MALIKETDEWVENIYLIEPNDPVEGGEDGVDNRPHIELANRTAFLNKKRKEQEQKTQEIDEKVNGLTTQVNEIQVTIQNGGGQSGDLDTKLAQEVQDRTEGDSHLQGQIDALKEQIAKIVASGGRDPNSPNKGEIVVDSDIVITYSARGGTWRNENSEPPSLTIRSIHSSDEKLVYQTNQSSATRQAIDRPPLLRCVATFKYPSDLIISDNSQVVIGGTNRQVAVGNVNTFEKTITLSMDLEFTSTLSSELRFNIKIKQG